MVSALCSPSSFMLLSVFRLSASVQPTFKSFHAQNLRRLFCAAEIELRLVALFPAHELFAQRGLRGDDEDFLFFVNDFRAAGARAEEVKRIFAAVLQFHQ